MRRFDLARVPHPHVSLPRTPSTPSRTNSGTIASAATGSAHHHPSVARSSNPPSRIADSHAQTSVCIASDASARLDRPVATPRFARARIGMTRSESAASTMPVTLTSGTCRVRSVSMASHATYEREPEERDTHHASRQQLGAFARDGLRILMQPPHRGAARGELDQAVHAEPGERHASRDGAGHERNHGLEAVPADGEPRQSLAAPGKRGTWHRHGVYPPKFLYFSPRP
jgi:hypothetical protein